MYARAERNRVRIGLWFNDADTFIKPLTILAEAEADFQAVRTELPSRLLRPYKERLLAAEQDVEDVFSDVYTIEQAEALASRLFAAITEAKANDGRFGSDE